MLESLIGPIGCLIVCIAICIVANTLISCQSKLVDVEIKKLNCNRLKEGFNEKEKHTRT